MDKTMLIIPPLQETFKSFIKKLKYLTCLGKN